MLGNFQHSTLRIEVSASAQEICDRLTLPAQLSQWLFPQQLKFTSNNRLIASDRFDNQIGPISIHSEVERSGDNCLRLRLSQGIDGFQEWVWGEGWVQSRLEGISLLPLNLYQTATLLRLQQALRSKKM
jgi:hypothetical protein